MKTFHKLLGIALLVITTNNFVWFALTYWAYLSTKSVISTSTMAGIFLVMAAGSGLWFGSLVDHHKKKNVMLCSSFVTLLCFIVGWIFMRVTPESAFTSITSVHLWIFVLLVLSASIVGSIYNIAIPTLVGVLVPENERDRANGLFGTVMGVSFAITSIASGVSLAFGGMQFILSVAVIGTIIAIITLSLTPLPEKEIIHTAEHGGGKVDIKGTIKVIREIPGLYALIFFTTFNNFLGGVFFALMDAYGLSLVPVQVWGTLWGILSIGFILGGLYIAKKGLGKDPLRILFRNNIITWTVCIFFTIQPSIILLAIGTFVWMFLFPFIEAIEQTIFQKVVPQERLGRVLGFAHSVEQGVSPLTAFLVGPLTQLFVIPFMTTGAGANLIGSWYGTGEGRGIALVFSIAGILGLATTLIAMGSKPYALLAERYKE